MNMEIVINYLIDYGAIIIFLALFCGIIGIPAPEESFLVFLGMICVNGQFSLIHSIFFACLGTCAGMVVAYVIGWFCGNPVIDVCGKFIGLSKERWQKMKEKYEKSAKKAIVFGYYLPGIRQVNPYFAGAARTSMVSYFICTIIGSILWVIPYVLVGYFFGQWFEIPLEYVSLLGVGLLLLFILSICYKQLRKKRVN